MIAQVVFDLPLDGPFDYLIPEPIAARVTVGTRVKVSFGPRPQIGFVIGLIGTSTIAKLKPIQSLCDSSAIFNSLDLTFAQEFCAYYGCSLGEALGTILRNKKDHGPSIHRDHKPLLSLYRCHPCHYAIKIQEIIDEYQNFVIESLPAGEAGSPKGNEAISFFILVPDTFRAETITQQIPLVMKDKVSIKIGTRSSVFECDGRHACVIMVDDQDSSYKQEQTPMYETRQVLLMRSKIYGFDIAFMGIAPSVELKSMVREGQVKSFEESVSGIPVPRLVDLTNYKFVPGLLSPPVRDALDAALKAGKKSFLILNRRGSYRLTRCVDCDEILKCQHCDSPLIYSRSAGKFLCRHCTYTAAGGTVCPKCHKPSWRSVGIGVEQLQTELKKYFPQAKIASFERAVKAASIIASDQRERSNLPVLNDFDILISTQAILRFQATWQAHMAAFIDFDAELNRLDMRSAFNAFSLAMHISSMAQESVFIQTRNSSHYVLQNLSRGNFKGYYDEELKLRKEWGFSPFKHWIKISWRGKLEKSTHEAATQVYNELSKSLSEKNYILTPPLPDAIGRKRGQFRFNVMVQANDILLAVSFIRFTLTKIKRPRRIIVTLNIDP